MIRDMIQSTVLTQATRDRLCKGFQAALRTADESTLAFTSEPTRLKRWRDAGIAVLELTLLPIRGADGVLDDDKCLAIFDFIQSLVWFLMGKKWKDTDLNAVWGVILDADREAGLFSYSLGFVTKGRKNDDMLVTNTELMLIVLDQLARYSPAIAARLIALGAMEICERVLNGEIRTFPRVKSGINDLYSSLMDATYPGQ